VASDYLYTGDALYDEEEDGVIKIPTTDDLKQRLKAIVSAALLHFNYAAL
jgi:hypothetical protein